LQVVATGVSPARIVEEARGALPDGGRTANGDVGNRNDAGSESGTNSEEDERWRPVLGLPCKLTVDLALPRFTVADFLKLRPASVIAAHWRLAQDVPLRLNGRLIGWVEFEVSGSNLAVRLTELA
jgi:flagellar motor switch/type III secretory pathway protein FliN